MSAKYKRTLWAILLTLVIVTGALALVAGRTKGRPGRASATRVSPPPSSTVMAQDHSRPNTRTRNLSLHPEAFNMGRRLGQRFSRGSGEKSSLVGNLTIGSERRIVHTTRSQTDEGETVEIKFDGTPGELAWDVGEGARSGNDKASGGDRDLVERLVLDSPDQFVMAQLRGASYRTVARNVRPVNADDNYSGPLWDIVRVGEPQHDREKRSQSAWRLYYIDTKTGLIGRIVSKLRGEMVEAEISEWTTVNGENVPRQITWTSQGQTVMQYRLTNFSRGQQ